MAFGILALQRDGHRRFETVIIGFLAIILLGFLYDTLQIGFDSGGRAEGFLPGFAGTDSVLLATGILGATVMPHVIYLHSALTQNASRCATTPSGAGCCATTASTSTIAMGIAGLVNMSMLIIAASLFHSRGLDIDSIEEAHHGLQCSSAVARRSPSRLPCWRPGWRPRASAPTPGRS